MRNFEKLLYTLTHRQAFAFVANKYFSDIEYITDEMCFLHDIDKMLFLTLCDDTKTASAWHRANATHHMENGQDKTYADMYEAIIDYECARYTKPDKPLNAYDTIIQFDKGGIYKDEMLKLLEIHGLDYSLIEHPELDEAHLISYSDVDTSILETKIAELLEEYKYYYPEQAAVIQQAALLAQWNV